MARQYANYSDQDIIDGAKEVKSLSGLLRKLELIPCGGNYGTIKIKLKSLGVNCDHWTGQGWNKDDQLKDWNKYTKRGSFKKLLLKERGVICEGCGLSEWCGKPIPLELDHIDGDGTNNNKENLKLLCCNCHALTPTWRGRACRGARKEKETKTCAHCAKEFVPNYKSQKYCTCHCANSYSRKLHIPKIKWPLIEDLTKMVEENGFSKTGRILGVSDNAIRKHIKRNGKIKSTLTLDIELP